MKKPIHISVVMREDGSVDVSFYFKDALVSDLSMINHELDLLKQEILSRLKDAPKEYQIEDYGEEEDLEGGVP